ncbi:MULTISPECIES: hypothetical protein [unclassified Kitasatospora]|uniref:hypothetical protein n=1 Tax=unclassified Kitasatospora TaxID=2633591 RepID=UPI002473F8C0|nr:hypothetical protein [Kitasatospora sp. MAP12-44]
MPRSRAGWLCRAWLVLVAGLVGVFLFGSSVPYELGYAGKPGKLTIESCETHGQGKSRRTDCTGSFTSNDGTVMNEYYGDESAYPAGKVLSRQRESADVLDPVGWGAAALTVSAVLGSLVLVGAGLQAFASVSRRHPTARQRAQRQSLAMRGRTLYPLPPAQRRVERAAWIIIAASLVGAAVMLCIGLLA